MDGGIRAKALHDEILGIKQHQTGHVSFGCLAAERQGAVDPEAGLGRMQVRQIAAEAGWDFNDESQLSAAHALFQLLGGADRRPFSEITGAREAFEQPAAFWRLVLVEGGVFQVLDIEGDPYPRPAADTAGPMNAKLSRMGSRKSLSCLEPGISPQSSGIESLECCG